MDQATRDRLAVTLVNDVDEWAYNEYGGGFRTHLGASVLGHPCDRYLYLSFRWAKPDSADGRMQRLYQRGKREEKVFNEYLRAIGFEVQDVDPATGEQWRINLAHGHLGGSSDGKVQLPERYGVPGWFVPEYKTNKTGADFNYYTTKGYQEHNISHYVQHSIYGKNLGIREGIYLNVDKNTDNIHCEFKALDWDMAERYEKRGENIIVSDYVPAKGVGFTKNYFVCKMCNMFGICHKGETMAKNCRSCIYSKPAENKAWNCTKYGETIPVDFIATGCDAYKALL